MTNYSASISTSEVRWYKCIHVCCFDDAGEDGVRDGDPAGFGGLAAVVCIYGSAICCRSACSCCCCQDWSQAYQQPCAVSSRTVTSILLCSPPIGGCVLHCIAPPLSVRLFVSYEIVTPESGKNFRFAGNSAYDV